MDQSQFLEFVRDCRVDRDVASLCSYFFKTNLTPGQEEIAKTVAFGEHKRNVITCMTRYGKSWSVSQGVMLWIAGHDDKKVNIVAPTNEKTSIIRNYIASFTVESPFFSELLDIKRAGPERIRKEVSKRRMTWRNGTEMRTLSAEDKGRQLMGFGADLVVVDEECDIDYETYRAKITRMLGESEDAVYVGIGNPWHRDNQMWQHWTNPDWNKIHIGWPQALAEGRVTQEFLDEQRSQLSAREFQVLYDAEFPETSEDALIDWNWIERAYKAKAEPADGTKVEVIAGIDVAELGNDLTVVTTGVKDLALNNYYARRIDSWGKMDLMPTVGKIVPILIAEKVEKVKIDAQGVGSGVYSRLEELKREGKLTCKVEAFKGGRSPATDQAKERFLNAKAESYWHLRKLFEEGKVFIPTHSVLISQLSKMKWELTSSEKIRIRDPGTKADDTSEQKSPDFSDSLNIMCWPGGRAPLAFGGLNLSKRRS